MPPVITAIFVQLYFKQKCINKQFSSKISRDNRLRAELRNISRFCISRCMSVICVTAFPILSEEPSEPGISDNLTDVFVASFSSLITFAFSLEISLFMCLISFAVNLSHLPKELQALPIAISITSAVQFVIDFDFFDFFVKGFASLFVP